MVEQPVGVGRELRAGGAVREQLNLSLDEETAKRLDAWRDGSGATRAGAALELLKVALDLLDWLRRLGFVKALRR